MVDMKLCPSVLAIGVVDVTVGVVNRGWLGVLSMLEYLEESRAIIFYCSCQNDRVALKENRFHLLIDDDTA